VRAPGDEYKKVQAAVAGDIAAAAVLWDAHGPRAYAFCHRLLGDADPAADAAQDAFLLALSEADPDTEFGVTLLRAARQASFELRAAGRAAGPRAGGLSAVAGRLRPQQRAALALAALGGLSYAQIATVLRIGAEAVPALLARARLRLYDELHGTALAAAAVRAPDCEDVVPLLASAADGELDAADAAWADPHVLRCPTCPRTKRAMTEAAATYAAWSSAAPPSWLRGATLAEVGAEAQRAPVLVAAGPPPPRRARRRAAGAWAVLRPSLPVALLGSLLVTAAFAALMLAGAGALRQQDPVRGGALLPEGAGSVQVASLPPAAKATRPATRRAAARRTHRHAKRRAKHGHRVTFVPVAAVRRPAHRVPSGPPRHRAPARPDRPAARPKRTRKPRPKPAAPPPAPPGAPAPVSADAPADELPASSATTADASPPSVTTPVAAPAPGSKPAAPVSAPAAAPPTWHDWHRGDRDGRSRRGPCPPRGRHDR
jgi:DNA-directed RNA polymerase specialized sigma24 family protein